jgi:WD40 repeat protein
MKPNAGGMRRAMVWLGVAWLSLVTMSPVSAQQATKTLEGHTGAVRCVTYSPDGKTLAAASSDHRIKLWDVATDKEQATLKGHTEWRGVIAVAFNPDGKTLASGNQDGTIELWDVATGKEQATLEGHLQLVCSVAFSPDGKTLASGSADHTIKLWDVTKR